MAACLLGQFLKVPHPMHLKLLVYPCPEEPNKVLMIFSFFKNIGHHLNVIGGNAKGLEHSLFRGIDISETKVSNPEQKRE